MHFISNDLIHSHLESAVHKWWTWVTGTLWLFTSHGCCRAARRLFRTEQHIAAIAHQQIWPHNFICSIILFKIKATSLTCFRRILSSPVCAGTALRPPDDLLNQLTSAFVLHKGLWSGHIHPYTQVAATKGLMGRTVIAPLWLWLTSNSWDERLHSGRVGRWPEKMGTTLRRFLSSRLAVQGMNPEVCPRE